MTTQIRGVALNLDSHVHLTEHLAPLCVILDIPLILTDPDCQQQAEHLYPGLKTLIVPWGELTPQYLFENFELLFQSSYWPRHRFYQTFEPFEEAHHKIVRHVHCPHGFSDKIFWLERCVHEDITLVYGQNMLDMFKHQGVFEELNVYIRCGNYRYSYYQKHQAFFDRIVEENIFSRFSTQQPVILYAPTHHDSEASTSFFDSDPIFQTLPSHYNLIVKIHPALEDRTVGNLYQMMAKFEKFKNVVFVKDFPLIYPILKRSDLYVGDMSSIGYDFLVFNRPMFFLNQLKRDSSYDRRVFLYQCGIEVMPEDYPKLYTIIEDHLPNDQERFSHIRSDVYHYTFGDEINFNELKTSLFKAYFSPRKW